MIHDEPVFPEAAPLDAALLTMPDRQAAPGNELRGVRHEQIRRVPDEVRAIIGLLLYADRVSLVGGSVGNFMNETIAVAEWVALQQVDNVGTAEPPTGLLDRYEKSESTVAREATLGRRYPAKAEEIGELYEALRLCRPLRLAERTGVLRTTGQLLTSTSGLEPLWVNPGAGARRLPGDENPMAIFFDHWMQWALTSPTVVPAGTVPSGSGEAGVRAAEGAIAGSLIGERELFPDADIDVVLDLRERLKTSRLHLRATIRAAAEELGDVPGDQLRDAVAGVRRKLVDDSLAEIREGIEELGAKPTLLRLSGHKAVAATVIATAGLAVAATHGAVHVGALTEALGGAGTFAAAASELGFRRSQKISIATRPFWILHEIHQLRSPQ